MSKHTPLQKDLAELDKALAQWLKAFDNRDRLVTVHQRLKGLAESARNAGKTGLGTQILQIEKPLAALVARAASGLPKENAMQTATALKALLTTHMDTEATSAHATRPPTDAGNDAAPIYVINNNALLGEDVAMQLRCFGHSVEVLADIERVEEIVAHLPPAALIFEFDYREDLLEKVARLARHRQKAESPYPITLISTRGNFKARLAAARAGVDCYFTKPVDIAALTDRLDALIFSKEAHPYRILLVGDDKVEVQRHDDMLRKAKMDTCILHSPAGIFEALDEYRPELVVMDVDTPECNGIDLTRLIRQNNVYLDVPIMFLADDGSLAHRLNAIHAGADGFLGKPFAAPDFVTALTSRAERYRALRGLIMRDSLTGLLNHSAIKETLSRELLNSTRNGMPLALAMIDIDFFKRVNDTHGHPVGDQVIRTLSRLLQQRLRRGDVVGRYGGEEFAVILPGASAAAALGVLDPLREAFSRIRHHAEDGHFTVSFSAGVAEVGAHDSAEALFRAADAALYEAKHKGRNRIELG